MIACVQILFHWWLCEKDSHWVALQNQTYKSLAKNTSVDGIVQSHGNSSLRECTGKNKAVQFIDLWHA